ncbi:unnamed protein product, partial [Iphiclides podalirius]
MIDSCTFEKSPVDIAYSYTIMAFEVVPTTDMRGSDCIDQTAILTGRRVDCNAHVRSAAPQSRRPELGASLIALATALCAV